MSAVDTLRDALFGNPPSSTTKPSEEGVLAAFTELYSSVASAQQGMASYATVADLPTDPAPAEGTQARVYADATEANNGVWIYKDSAWTFDTEYYDNVATVVQPLVDSAKAWAESETPPDPDDPASKSAKTYAAAVPALLKPGGRLANQYPQPTFADGVVPPTAFGVGGLVDVDAPSLLALGAVKGLWNASGTTSASTRVKVPIAADKVGRYIIMSFYVRSAAPMAGTGSFSVYYNAAGGSITTGLTYSQELIETGSGYYVYRCTATGVIPAGAVALGIGRILNQRAATDYITGITYAISRWALTSDNFAYDDFSVPNDPDAPTAPTPEEGDNSTRIATTAFVETLASRSDAYAYAENEFPNPLFEGLDGAATGWTPNLPLVVVNGRTAIETPSSADAAIAASPQIDLAGFTSGFLSASFLLEEKDENDLPADLLVRLTFFEEDGATRVDAPAGSDTDDGHYTRFLPTAAVSAPTWIVLAAGITIPAGARYVRVYVRWATTAQAKISRFTVRDGKAPGWVEPRSNVTRDAVTVGVDGKYETFNEALDAIGGVGTMILNHARDYGSEMRIDPTKCRGPVTIIGELANGLRPRILLDAARTDVALVAGETKIYRCGFGGSSTPPHVWIHDLPDAATAIPLEERHPLHDGRLNRLPSTQIKRLDAADLATALGVMRASDDPLCYVDSGWLYMTGPAGLDLTAEDIRFDSETGLFSSADPGAAASIEIVNLDVRYGGINLRAFRQQRLCNVSSIGSQNNGIDWIGDCRFSKIETAGAAYWGGSTLGDGFNGHTGGFVQGEGFYSHDNADDGESSHENCSGIIRNFLCEDNGGTAVAPAFGNAMIYEDGLSRRNVKAGLKYAAFQIAGSPDPADDPGFDTIAIFRRCRSVGDPKGFRDKFGSTGHQERAICEDCTVEDMTGPGPAFDVYEVSNCRLVGDGLAKAASTIVREAGTLVA